MSKQESQQIFERLSVLLLTVAKGEQVQQCIRETMTTHQLFNPLALFRYISRNGTVIKKEHLLAFLEENKQAATEEQIKAIFESQGSKKSWQYSDFLQVVYPYNSATLREITNHHLKKYQQLSKHMVDESAVTAFLILLTEKLQLIRKLEVQKGDSLQKVSKERVKKVLVSIKKLAGKQPSHCENDDTRITGLELRCFLKAYVSVEEGHFLYLARRLGIKNGSFPIQNLQKFLRPNKKQKKGKTAKIQGSIVLRQSNKVLDQISYKQQLYKDLADSIKQKSASTSQYSSALKPKISNTPQRNTTALKEEKRVHIIGQQQNPSFYKRQINKCKKQVESLSFERLFLTFIETFLPAAKQLNELRIKATQQRIDFLALFKQIDRSHRGVATAQDLHEYYIKAGGRVGFIPKEFDLIISRYGQSEEPWLTFAEFCDMIRTEDKEGFNRNIAKFGQNQGDLVVNILEISLNNELALTKIRKFFSKSDAKSLFDQINISKTGFLNYQQLKKYLNQANLSLSMQDLMIILKQLDKSRNGVVVEHEFVQYFTKH